MKKNNFYTLFLIGFWVLLLGIAVPMKGQTYTTIFSDNFDSYTVGNTAASTGNYTTTGSGVSAVIANAVAANSGTKYVNFSGSNASNNYYLNKSVSLTAGKTYVFSVYTNSPSSHNHRIGIKTAVATNYSNNTWTQLSTTFTATTTENTNILVYLFGIKTVYVDDILFQLKQWNINASSNNVSYGSVSGTTGLTDPGTSVSLTATPQSGYYFVNWTEGGSTVSTSATYTFPSSADRTLVANFESSSSSITVDGTLSPFSSTYGTASAQQSFTVAGTSLSSSVFVTPPTGFEVSLTSGSGFQSSVSIAPSSGTIASTPVYIRMKATAPAATYSAANITINNQTLSCSGTQAKKALSVSGYSIAAKDYNGNTTSGAITVGTITGFVGSETVTATATCTLSSPNVYGETGTIVYTLVNGTNGGLASNYSLANKTYWAQINQRQLNITAGNQTVTYGTAASAVTGAGSYTPSGFVGSDNSGVMTGTATYTTTYTNTTAAGTAGVTISYNTGLNTTYSNYWFNKIAGTITITKANPTLSVSGTQSFTYNGSAQGPAEVSYNGDGGTPTLLYTSTDGGGYSSATAPTNVGAYQVVASATAGTNFNAATSNAYPFTIYSSGSISSATNVSSLTLSPSSTLSVASGATLTIDANTEVASVTVAQGGKLTLSGSSTLAVSGGITLQNTADGTASFVDERTSDSPTAIAGTVEQAIIGKDRNWYVAIPVSGKVASEITLTDASIVKRNEATASWETITANTTLTPGMGYIALASTSSGNTSWTLAGNLNSGKVEVGVTKSGTGYNLLGNPYPSYLNWEQVLSLNATNESLLQGKIWYRTAAWNAGLGKYVYTFNTYNSTSRIASPLSTSGYIPPMQAFWVRANSAGTVTFTNAMRSHGNGESNKLKAPALNTQKIVRLQVANAANITDEAVVYFNSAAQNSFDAYDSEKMFNNSTSYPEIFTQAGSEKLVINGLNAVQYDAEIPLGFSTLAAGDFSISRTEFSNFESGTRILLKDKLYPTTEFELAEGQSYNFSAQPTTATTDRFSLVFRAPGVTTAVDNTTKPNAQVFVNAANQITIIAPLKSNYAIYNAMGQLIYNGALNTERETLNAKLNAGMYVVKVGNVSTRVVVK